MKTTVIFCLFLSLVACSESNTTETNPSVESPNGSVEKPNKFKVAAIKKVKLANAGFDDTQATCVVEQMTAGGKIGLGEINQMRLDEANMSDNASNLIEAYQTAINHCE